MGFGPIFLGIMFLYDFQLGLRHTGGTEAYAMVDIFPDLLGWILLFLGLRTLSKKASGFDVPLKMTFLMMLLSLVSLGKDTVFYNSFYAANVQNFAGEITDFVIHALELVFLVLLFRPMPALCRKKGEDKLAVNHDTISGIAYAEGATYLIAWLGRALPLPAGTGGILSIVSKLDFIFLVFLVWYAAITMFRTMMRISD